MDGSHKNCGGETPGRREAMDRMAKNLIDNGNKPEYAKRVVLGCAVRADRRAERKRTRRSG